MDDRCRTARRFGPPMGDCGGCLSETVHRALRLMIMLGALASLYPAQAAAQSASGCHAWAPALVRAKIEKGIAALDRQQQVLYLGSLGTAVAEHGKTAEALLLFRKAHGVARVSAASESSIEQTFAFANMALNAQSAHKAGFDRDSIDWLRDAASLARHLGADEYNSAASRQSDALSTVATAMWKLGEKGDAEALLREAVALAERLEGNASRSAEERQAFMLRSIAERQARAKDVDSARETLERAVAIAWKIPLTNVVRLDPFSRLSELGWTVHTFIQMEDLERALQLARTIFDPSKRTEKLGEVARAFGKRGDAARAEAIAREALEVAPFAVGTGGLWYSNIAYAATHIAAAGFPELAVSLLPVVRTRADSDPQDTDVREGNALVEIARAFARKHDLAAAEKTLSELPQLARQRAELVLGVAGVIMISGALPEGRRWRERALAVAADSKGAHVYDYAYQFDESLLQAALQAADNDFQRAMTLVGEITSPSKRASGKLGVLRTLRNSGASDARERLCAFLVEALDREHVVGALTEIYADMAPKR